jgi:hypothetical protein
VVGEDVVKLLEKAIQRHPDMDIEVKKYLFQILTYFFTRTRYYRNFCVLNVFFR